MADRCEPEAGDGPLELRADLRRARRRARIWTGICVASGVVAFSGNFLPDRWVGFPLVGLVIFLATMWPAYRLRARYGHEVRRREAQPLTAGRVVSVERPPVLYLRSFDDDQRASRIKGELTEEEHLAKVFSDIGPFVAIGRPGELLPTTGAARIYVGDVDWEAAVEDLLIKARLVVIRTGRTTGLAWELERAVRLLKPEQLVLLVDNPRELRSLLDRIRKVHPQLQSRVRTGWRSIGSIRAFVIFDQEWRAGCLRARGPGLYFFCTKQGEVGHAAKRLAWTLRPLFTTLGERWRRPPLNTPLIVLSALSAGLFIAAIVLTLLGY